MCAYDIKLLLESMDKKIGGFTYQKIFTLKTEGYNIDEIKNLTSLSKRTINRRIKEIREKLKKEYPGYFLGFSVLMFPMSQTYLIDFYETSLEKEYKKFSSLTMELKILSKEGERISIKWPKKLNNQVLLKEKSIDNIKNSIDSFFKKQKNNFAELKSRIKENGEFSKELLDNLYSMIDLSSKLKKDINFISLSYSEEVEEINTTFLEKLGKEIIVATIAATIVGFFGLIKSFFLD